MRCLCTVTCRGEFSQFTISSSHLPVDGLSCSMTTENFLSNISALHVTQIVTLHILLSSITQWGIQVFEKITSNDDWQEDFTGLFMTQGFTPVMCVDCLLRIVTSYSCDLIFFNTTIKFSSVTCIGMITSYILKRKYWSIVNIFRHINSFCIHNVHCLSMMV